MPHRSTRRSVSATAAALAATPLIAVLAAAPSAQPQPVTQEGGPVPLTVMTFNIRTSGNSDRDGANGWPHRRALVVETIGRFAPQVAGLQEALAEQLDYLSETLPDYRWLGVDRGLNGGVGLSEFTPIFYRHRELLPIESGTFWLSPTPTAPTGTGFRRRVSRIVTWAYFHHIATDRRLYVYNTHLTLRQGERQVQSATMIAEQVAALPDGTPVVVTGDFNAMAEVSDTWRAATAHRPARRLATHGSPDRPHPHVERLPSAGAGERGADRLDPGGRAGRGPFDRDRHRSRQRALPLRPLPGRRADRPPPVGVCCPPCMRGFTTGC